jgi:hypothetical protein
MEVFCKFYKNFIYVVCVFGFVKIDTASKTAEGHYKSMRTMGEINAYGNIGLREVYKAISELPYEVRREVYSAINKYGDGDTRREITTKVNQLLGQNPDELVEWDWANCRTKLVKPAPVKAEKLAKIVKDQKALEEKVAEKSEFYPKMTMLSYLGKEVDLTEELIQVLTEKVKFATHSAKSRLITSLRTLMEGEGSMHSLFGTGSAGMKKRFFQYLDSVSHPYRTKVEEVC